MALGDIKEVLGEKFRELYPRPILSTPPPPPPEPPPTEPVFDTSSSSSGYVIHSGNRGYSSYVMTPSTHSNFTIDSRSLQVYDNLSGRTLPFEEYIRKIAMDEIFNRVKGAALTP
jgi:hypothetical protein